MKRRYNMYRDHHIVTKQAWYELKRLDPTGAKYAEIFQKNYQGNCHFECECVLAYLKIFSPVITEPIRFTKLGCKFVFNGGSK